MNPTTKTWIKWTTLAAAVLIPGGLIGWGLVQTYHWWKDKKTTEEETEEKETADSSTVESKKDGNTDEQSVGVSSS